MSERICENSFKYLIPKPQMESHYYIAECHNLHVCPSACGRRSAIYAYEHGLKHKVSFLNISEADVVTGNYEEIVADAVAELVEVLQPSPRAFMIFFKCVDDFLATDETALLQALRERFPLLHFAICRINPVRTDNTTSMGMNYRRQLYSFLEYSGKKDDGVNFVCVNVPIDAECELYSVLAGWGIHHVRNVAECSTFDEILRQADSRLNLVFMQFGELAAETMQKELDIPYYLSPASYDIDVVLNDYRNMAHILGQDCSDFREEIAATRSAIRQTKELIGEIPVAVDSYAIMKPLAFARAMVGYGFNMRAVFTDRIRDYEVDDYAWLAQNSPQVEIMRSESYQTVLGSGIEKDCIAIGKNSAFSLQARHFVDIKYDETFFGFQGIRKMMRYMRQAYQTTYEWQKT